MNKTISVSVKNSLYNIAEKTDILLKKSNISLLYKKRKFNKISKKTQINYESLYNQLPNGLYSNPNEIANLISTYEEKTTENAVNFSPLVIDYKEFTTCKQIKFGKGNIITGREKEIEQILLTLCKKDKRGVLLVGAAGCGKSSVAQAINARLIQRTVPRQLIGAKMFNMDIPYIFSKHGQEGISVIIKNLEKASEYDKAILFIDEVHQIMNNKMNDILKPYLTEKIRFIGSTTIDEYHTIINEDPAIERRFTVINIEEPDIDQTIEMVYNTKSVFEDHHKCIINRDICDYLVKTGSRFMGHRKNPDKSLDLLDIACSILNELEIKDFIPEINNLDYFNNLENKKNQVLNSKCLAGNRILQKHHIDKAISSTTGINYEDIKNSLDYEFIKSKINNVVLDQDTAISQIANVSNIIKHISYKYTKPISILLLVGPSGTGKKTACRNLANLIFGNNNHFIDYDMSGMQSEFMITELKGAPPGYVGYGKSGGLVKKIKNNPQSLLYFRNIHKAHSTIIQYLVDCVNNGYMTDSAERIAHLNNSIIIFSVTLTEEETNKVFKNKTIKMGFQKPNETKNEFNKDNIKELVGEELYKIANELIVFKPLSKNTLEKIFDKNKDQFLESYTGISIDPTELKNEILIDSKNGHDVISKLTSRIPQIIFNKVKTGVKKDENKK